MDDALEHLRAENGERSTAELELKFDTLRPIFGNRSASEITKQEIVRWLTDTAEDREWAAGTRNRWQAAFSLVFRVGIDNEKIEKNPAARIRRKSEDNQRVRFLSDAEEKRLRTVISSAYPEHLDALDISVHTGARSGEQFGMKWDQVDFNNRLVKLPNKRKEKGTWRYVPLNSVALNAFKRLRKVNSHSPWVFLNSKGERLRGPRDWFEPAIKEAKIPDYTWHCNRHTFASRLVMAGVDLRTVAQLMGHRTIQLTMRYAHLAPDHQQSAVERLVKSSAAKSRTATTAATGKSRKAATAGAR